MKYLSTLLWVFLLFSCSSETDEIIPESPAPDNQEKPDVTTNKYHLKLGIKESTKNVFNLIGFYLQDEDKNGLHVSFAELKEVYDSICWEIPGQQGALSLFSWEEGDGFSKENFTPSWSHCFYRPGHYETKLLGYKDNKIIYSDTLKVDIVNQKDFLMHNWDEIKESGQYEGHQNAVNEAYLLCSQAKMYGDYPTISLSFWNSLNEEENVFAEKSDTQLYNYITSIYNQPTYDRGSLELADKYKELFSHREEKTEPCAIWLTQKNKIVLLMSDNDPWKECWIHVEPIIK